MQECIAETEKHWKPLHRELLPKRQYSVKFESELGYLWLEYSSKLHDQWCGLQVSSLSDLKKFLVLSGRQKLPDGCDDKENVGVSEINQSPGYIAPNVSLAVTRTPDGSPVCVKYQSFITQVCCTSSLPENHVCDIFGLEADGRNQKQRMEPVEKVELSEGAFEIGLVTPDGKKDGKFLQLLEEWGGDGDLHSGPKRRKMNGDTPSSILSSRSGSPSLFEWCDDSRSSTPGGSPAPRSLSEFKKHYRKDALWKAIEPSYQYLMDKEIIETCRVRSVTG